MASLSIVLVLDNIRSMHNVGSIFRTADAFGVDAIYLCGFTPSPPHRDIQKTALGATESVHWKTYANAIDAIHELKSSHFSVVAIEQTPASESLAKFVVPSQKVALVFGNEVDGVQESVLSESAGSVHIPQQGLKKSLNVSVCVGVVLWHCRIVT